MASKTGTIDYKALQPKYETMFRDLDKAQWAIGKSLYEDGIVSDGQRQRLGELIGRSPKTLQEHYLVYVNFCERFPDGRPEKFSHGVLKELIRLGDETEQNIFLAKYPRPTHSQAEQFVNEKIAEKTGRPRVRRGVDTTSLKVGGVVFRIAVTESGHGTVTMEGATKVGTALKSEVSEGTWTLEFSE